MSTWYKHFTLNKRKSEVNHDIKVTMFKKMLLLITWLYNPAWIKKTWTTDLSTNLQNFKWPQFHNQLFYYNNSKTEPFFSSSAMQPWFENHHLRQLFSNYWYWSHKLKTEAASMRDIFPRLQKIRFWFFVWSYL